MRSWLAVYCSTQYSLEVEQALEVCLTTLQETHPEWGVDWDTDWVEVDPEEDER